MSKCALRLVLTFIITTSILFSSLVPAKGAELTEEPAAASESFTDAAEEVTDAPEPSTLPVSKADHPVLTVNAVSNYFGRVKSEYNEFTREVTVTYMLHSSKRLLCAQWALSYESSVLHFDPEKNPADKVCPLMKKNAVITSEEEEDGTGCISFNAANIHMFDYSNGEAVFAKIVFDVKDLTPQDSENTKVDMCVSELCVSEPDPSNGNALSDKEIFLVTHGYVVEDKKVESVRITKYVTLTKSNFNENDYIPASPDQAVVTSPAATAATAVTEPAVTEPAKKEKPKKAENGALLQTGKWYVALLILLVLLACSTVLFVMRKRDIYND